MVHSKNMGEGVVPFSHDGFDERMAEMGGWGGAENVAYNYDGGAGAV